MFSKTLPEPFVDQVIPGSLEYQGVFNIKKEMIAKKALVKHSLSI